MSDLEKLVLLGLHTQPTSAVVEIDALVDVVAWAQEVAKDSLFDTLVDALVDVDTLLWSRLMLLLTSSPGPKRLPKILCLCD